MIAIVTHQQAVEADRVIALLGQRGRPVIRVNTGPAEAEVVITLVGGQPRAVVRCDGRTATADQITGGWAHQSPPLSAGAGATVADAASESSRMRMWEAFTDLVPDRAWLTAPSRLATVGNKVRQLVAAGRAGLTTPFTIVGNDIDALSGASEERWLAKYLGDSGRLWAAGPNGHAAVTIAIEPASLDARDVALSPAIFQHRVDSTTELRVVAIRRPQADLVDTFSAAAVKPPDVVDIRLSNAGRPEYVAHELPTAVRAQLTSMMDELRVGFCSADLLVTPEGDHVFLDLNSTGAWWWVDDLHDGRVAGAIADALGDISDANGAR